MCHLSTNTDWPGAQAPCPSPPFCLPPQDKKDFIEMRVKRLLKAGVISALACMVKADSAILTDQTKELLARCGCRGPGLGSGWAGG